MTSADYADKPLLDLACPTCSILRERHPELLNDVLAFPSILFSAPSTERRYRDGKYRVIGCGHVKSIFGPYQSEADAREAIREHFAGMRCNPYGHTMQEQSRAAGETPGDGEAQPGEAERGAAQEGAAEVSPSASWLPGEDAAAVAEAPLCRSGGSIRANHEVNIAGFCRWCGWEYPKLNIKP